MSSRIFAKAPDHEAQKVGSRLEDLGSWLLMLLLLAVGIACLVMPSFLYTLALNLVLAVLIIYGVFLVFLYFLRGRSSRWELILGLSALVFAGLLMFNVQLPEWIIRVTFGWYCVFIFLAMLVQIVIHRRNHVKVFLPTRVLCLCYGVLGGVLLLTHIVNTETLIRLFGAYFMLLSWRMLLHLMDLHSNHYTWRRGLYVSLPTVMAAFLPDLRLQSINNTLRTGHDYPLRQIKSAEPAKLKVMVHIGPEGFQKVGHFTFSWKGLVYSYGNYDVRSERFMSLLGDGVFFTVPADLYIPNLVKYERNTLFEYTIQTTEEQDRRIEEQLARLRDRSIRWYCDIERKGTPVELGALESDFPCRLHYRTGAKFYKLKNGDFKTYWVAGDNCVLFSDLILGSIGADVLSLRGIVTPGAYFDYLEHEYAKENSPVIRRRVHAWAASQDGI